MKRASLAAKQTVCIRKPRRKWFTWVQFNPSYLSFILAWNNEARQLMSNEPAPVSNQCKRYVLSVWFAIYWVKIPVVKAVNPWCLEVFSLHEKVYWLVTRFIITLLWMPWAHITKAHLKIISFRYYNAQALHITLTRLASPYQVKGGHVNKHLLAR